jgi:hypothetical protein
MWEAGRIRQQKARDKTSNHNFVQPDRHGGYSLSIVDSMAAMPEGVEIRVTTGPMGDGFGVVGSEVEVTARVPAEIAFRKAASDKDETEVSTKGFISSLVFA